MKKIKISKWIIPQLLIFFIIGKRNFFLGFLFILIHEVGHYLMAKKLNIKVDKFKVHLLGATLELDDYEGIDINDEFIIAIAGPLTNILIAFFSYVIFKYYGIEFCIDIAEINITLGVLNLIPAYPLDGAKILKCILTHFCLYKNANRFINYISIIFGFIIATLGVILVFINIININLILIGVFIIYLSYKDKNKSMYIVLDQLIKKQSRFKKKKYIANQCVSVYYKESMLSIISYIEKNKFNVFYVLDDDMRFLYKIREEEIFEILKNYGNVSLEEYYLTVYKNNKGY